jgi:hypothetical protein
MGFDTLPVLLHAMNTECVDICLAVTHVSFVFCEVHEPVQELISETFCRTGSVFPNTLHVVGAWKDTLTQSGILDRPASQYTFQ